MNVRRINYSRCIQVIKMTTKHNVLKVHGHNSYGCEKLKFDLVYLLRKNKVNIATDVEFKKGGKCDILDLDNSVCYLFDREDDDFGIPLFLKIITIRKCDIESYSKLNIEDLGKHLNTVSL